MQGVVHGNQLEDESRIGDSGCVFGASCPQNDQVFCFDMV